MIALIAKLPQQHYPVFFCCSGTLFYASIKVKIEDDVILSGTPKMSYYNYGHINLRIFDFSPISLFTTSETKPDY